MKLQLLQVKSYPHLNVSKRFIGISSV